MPFRAPVSVKAGHYYHTAQIKARRAAGGLTTDALGGIADAVDQYLADLITYYGTLKRATARERAVIVARIQVAQRVNERLTERLEAALDHGITTTQGDIREIWAEASELALKATAKGGITGNPDPDAPPVPDGVTPGLRIGAEPAPFPTPTGAGIAAAGARLGASSTAPLLGEVGAPGIQLATAYEARRVGGGLGADIWKTALRKHVAASTAEMDTIVRGALINNVGQDALAKSLRAYVKGSEAFHDAFGDQVFDAVQRLHDGLPPELKGAALRMKANAERIAITEIQHARVDAERESFLRDPYVVAVKWIRMWNRGASSRACVCDLMATADWYGLGPGVYPIEKIPPSAHPHCRCEREPITSDEPVARDAKPNPLLGLDPADADIPARQHGHARGPTIPLTEAAGRAIRRDAAKLLATGEQGAAGIPNRTGSLGTNNIAPHDIPQPRPMTQVHLTEEQIRWME